MGLCPLRHTQPDYVAATHLRYNSHMKKPINKLKGFTLVEILVVIAIIGVLSLIVFASFDDSRKKARDTARISDMQQLGAALHLYGSTYGSYPSASDGECTGTNSFGPSGCLQVLVSSGIYQALPQDPVNADSHIYQYDNSCANPSGSGDNRYRAWTIGEREQGATASGWTDSNTIGITSCLDPE